MTNTLKLTLSRMKEMLSVFSLVSMEERQCKFPLACILRQSWQDEVITEWLTHQHGEDLSPPGREIAKSQFTHIGLPVRAWSRSCKRRSHTQTLWDCAVTCAHAHTPTCSKAPPRHGLQPRLVYFSFLFHIYAVRVLVCHHMPRPSPCFLSNTPTCTFKACGMTALCRCVWEREQQRGSERQMTPEYCLIYIPSLNNNSTLEDGSFDPLTHRCISHAATYVA